MKLLQQIVAFLEDRLALPTIWARFTDRQIPKGVGWLQTFGSATLFLLIVQVVTGIFLAFYYVPSPEHAYESVRLITDDLNFGWLIRGIHRWSASLVVVFAVLHLLRTFFMGAYKYPRELTWVVGVLLLLVIFAFAFTGYLLPWDQRAYWATTVGTHIAGFAPGIGDFLIEILRGQPDIGARTLGRFYAFHTLFLPLILFLLLGIHLFIVIKQGIAPLPDRKLVPATREEYRQYYRQAKQEGKPFYESMAKDALVALFLLIVLIALSVVLGAPLEEEADPTSTTYVPKPEWYFLFLYELLWWFPGKWIPVATFWIPLALIFVLIGLPWLDSSVHRHPLRRPVVTVAAVTLVGFLGLLTYKGTVAPLPPTAVAAQRAQAEKIALSPLALQGLEVYGRGGCSACHAINGVGGVAGPDLGKIGRKRSADWLKKFVRDPSSMNPQSSMPAYKELSQEELEALVSYLGQIK